MNNLTAEATEEASALDSKTVEYIRERCRTDLYFLSKSILGRPDVNLQTHGLMCRFIVEEPSNKRLLLMPRGHLKTAVATVDDSVRLTLKDSNARILLANEIDGTATSIMNEIKQHFEKNQTLQMFFPEYIHERFAGPGIRWSSDGAFLPNRTINDKTPTFMSRGVGGAVTGMHFTRIKADDLIGFDSKESPTVMESTKRWIDNLEPLLVAPSFIMDFIGTRWTMDDIYAYLMESFPSLAVMTRGAIENNEPIFPRNADGSPRFTMEFYDEMRLLRPDMFYSQYENNPQTGGRRDFEGHRVRDFWIENGRVVYANSTGVQSSWAIRELDIVAIADPSGDKTNATNPNTKKNDDAGIEVVGVSPSEQVFSLESVSQRSNPTEFVDRLFDACLKWRPRVVGIEQAGLATTLHYFQLKCKSHKTYFRTEALRPKNRVKHDRIRTTLEPVISTDRMFVPKAQRILRSQLDFFPNIKEDAVLDCLAYYAELAHVGTKAISDKERNKRVDDLLAQRNPLTGY